MAFLLSSKWAGTRTETTTASTRALTFNALSLPYAHSTPNLSAAACAVSACAVHMAKSSASEIPCSAGTCARGPHLPPAPIRPTRNGSDCVIVSPFRGEFQVRRGYDGDLLLIDLNFRSRYP